MCDVWRNSFARFYADMGPAPPGHTLDRIDHNGHYEASNCRWSDAKAQANNRRSNTVIEYRGESKSVTEWGRITGLGHQTILKRIARGWSVDRAMTEPVRSQVPTHGA